MQQSTTNCAITSKLSKFIFKTLLLQSNDLLSTKAILTSLIKSKITIYYLVQHLSMLHNLSKLIQHCKTTLEEKYSNTACREMEI
jgi:hypothetical protein